jgi:dihydrofolate synthase / folylpolyglutamate synthase
MPFGDGPATSVDEVVEHLRVRLSSSPDALFRGGEGFARSAAFMDLLGEPQDRCPVVHIAGTAGKGTVAHAVARQLIEQGVRVGMHVSPHVYDLRERWQVDGRLCSDETVVALFHAVQAAAAELAATEHGPPTFYEMTLGMALIHFVRSSCDVVVLETGLGGLYDATNTVRRRDKIAVITRLGLDHTAVLGETLEEIATQKAGILPVGGRGVALRPEARSVEQALANVAADRSCKLLLIDGDADGPETGARPRHSRENAAVARAALEAVGDLLGLDLSSVREPDPGPMPGRFETIDRAGRPRVVLDGAHNPLKVEALVDRMHVERPDQRWRVVFGCRQDKRLPGMLAALSPIADSFGAVEFDVAAGDGPAARSTPASEIVDAWNQIAPIRPARVLEGDREIVDFISGSARPVLVVGSFPLLARVRPLLADRRFQAAAHRGASPG